MPVISYSRFFFSSPDGRTRGKKRASFWHVQKDPGERWGGCNNKPIPIEVGRLSVYIRSMLLLFFPIFSSVSTQSSLFLHDDDLAFSNGRATPRKVDELRKSLLVTTRIFLRTMTFSQAIESNCGENYKSNRPSRVSPHRKVCRQKRRALRDEKSPLGSDVSDFRKSFGLHSLTHLPHD